VKEVWDVTVPFRSTVERQACDWAIRCGESSAQAGGHGLAADAAVPCSCEPLEKRVLLSTQHTFDTATFYATGNSPGAVAEGDFTGNGRVDLAVISGNALDILLNTGGGNFAAPITCALSSTPYSIVAGDFNGDGRADLAITDSNCDVSILMSNGNGTFAPAVSCSAGAVPSPWRLAISTATAKRTWPWPTWGSPPLHR